MVSIWAERAGELVKALGGGDPALTAYREADADMVRRAVGGVGPDGSRPDPEAGMRVAFNISSAHVPALLKAGPVSPEVKPYWNRYDREPRLGEPPPTKPRLRERIDAVVGRVAGLAPKDMYYGALELNGSGVRYFGDFCLILQPSAVDDGTLALSRNSYDLSRKPVVDDVLAAGDQPKIEAKAEEILKEWAGEWPDEIKDMAVCKVLDGAPPARRRMTTGLVSAKVLDDEDYLEVVREGSFGAEHLEEIRLSAADAAADARTGDRVGAGPAPSLAEQRWRLLRRASERAAGEQGVPVRVVTAMGRDRG